MAALVKKAGLSLLLGQWRRDKDRGGGHGIWGQAAFGTWRNIAGVKREPPCAAEELGWTRKSSPPHFLSYYSRSCTYTQRPPPPQSKERLKKGQL